MASAHQNFPIWDSRNTEEKSIVKWSEKYKDLLNKKRSKLIEIIQPDFLWTSLRQYNVLNEAMQKQMKLNATAEESVERLFDHLERGPCWRLHAFLKALKDTSQEHVIELMGLDPEVYNEVPENITTSDIQEPASKVRKTDSRKELKMQEGLRKHRDYYLRSLMRGKLFDFKHKCSEKTFDVTECYIEQDIDQQKIKIRKKIERENILKGIDGGRKPQTILLSGSPGAGKTMFLKHVAYTWSKAYEDHIANPTANPKPEHDVVIYVHALDMEGEIWDCVKNNLYCKDDEKEVIMEQIREGQTCSILLDALDEIRNHETLENVACFIEQVHKKGGPQILVTARTGLSRMKNDIFDRFLHLEGFALTQGVQYVNQYLSQQCEGGTPTEDLGNESANKLPQRCTQSQGSNVQKKSSTKIGDVLLYVEKHKKRMEAILCNPLRAHIFCGLAVVELLPLDEDKILKPLDLLMCLEEYSITRESGEKGVSDEERHNFYKLCLHGVLKGIRKFTSEDLSQFNLSDKSPYVRTFCIPHDVRDRNAKRVKYFSFVHESLFEFFAARCFEILPDGYKKAVILSMCSEDVLQNVREMICAILREYETVEALALITGMIKVMVMLKATHGLTMAPKMSRLSNLRSKIRNILPASTDLLLRQDLDTELSSKVDDIWNTVHQAFRNPSDKKLKDHLIHILRPVGDVMFAENMRDIEGCLYNCTNEQKKHIIKNSIYLLLPLERLSNPTLGHISGKDLVRVSISPTGTLRWSQVEQYSNTLYVLGHYHGDCIEALQQDSQRHPNAAVPSRSDQKVKHVSLVSAYTHPIWEALEYTFLTEVHSQYKIKELFQTIHASYECINKISITSNFTGHNLCALHCIRLLDQLHTLDQPVPEVCIDYGKIHVEDLKRWWCEKGHMYQGRITLELLTLILPPAGEHHEQLLQWVGENLSEDLVLHIRTDPDPFDIDYSDNPIYLGSRIEFTSLIYFETEDY